MWAYDEQGRLRAKNYPDPVSGAVVAGSGPVYTNSPAGRLQTRDWKRGVRTTYAYSAAGDLGSVNYSDGTPGVVYTYDRRGRLATVARNGITTALTYNDANQPLTETHSSGTLALLSMNWAYDTSLRLSAVTAKNGASTLQSATYGYDTAGRLQSVTDSPRSAAYTYHANSTLISAVTLTNSGTAGLVSTRAYDKLNRLLSISTGTSSNGVGGAALSYGYQYNAANQRTRRTEADGTYWVYGYDALGQVVWGRRYWGDGTPVAGQQFEYGFDDTGNRESTGGRASAVGSYTNNLLNQLTGRGVAPYVDVLGLANPTTNVTVRVVGGTTYNASRKGEYFHHPLSVANATAQYPQIEVKSLYGATQTDTGRVFVPPAGEVSPHDADGNLTADGRWTYTWDGENRLVQMIRDTDTPAGARQKLVFEYDHQGRRIRKQFFTHNGCSWVEQRDTICLYEGWSVVAELDANASKARLRTYVWGLDLSGTRQGAGGVGGLLWVNNYQTSYGGQTLPTGVQYAVLDGNGNVVGLTKAADGTLSARYEYGPFGETVRQTGVLADAQPFRFSTKWTDVESGFLSYGYRYNNPSTGRWLSRDPIEELDGPNLYEAFYNNPLSYVDRNGLDNWSNPSAGQNAPPVFIFPPASFLPVSGDFTFTVTDAAHHTAIGSIVVGIEMTRTGELRLQYDRLAQELKRLGLSDEAAKAARTALQEEFRNKGPALFRAWTQKILEERARIGHQNLKDNPFKTNAKLNARAKVLSGAGRAVAVLGFAVEAYNLYQTPADELPSQAAKAGGRLGGGFIGGAGAGALGGSWGGPWGAAVGALIGGVAGSIAGEGVVEACVEKK